MSTKGAKDAIAVGGNAGSLHTSQIPLAEADEHEPAELRVPT